MRGIAIGRKNYMFVGSERGGKSAAIIYTSIEIAKLNGVDPHVRPARHNEYRLGQSVRVLHLDGSAAALRCPYLNGWQRQVLGQHLSRTTVAVPTIRLRLSARLGNRIIGRGLRQAIDCVLQPQAPAFLAWQQTTHFHLFAAN